MRARVRSSAKRDQGNGQGHVAGVLGGMARRELFEALAYVQQRQAQLTMLRDLLQGELHRRMSSPQVGNGQELLTVPEVAKALKVSLPRAYELARNGLPSVKVGQRQVRVRRADLEAYLAGKL